MANEYVPVQRQVLGNCIVDSLQFRRIFANPSVSLLLQRK